jgi:outer membrane receptor protein involved in Fe transport
MRYKINNKHVHVFVHALSILILVNTSFAGDVNNVGQQDYFNMSLTDLMEVELDAPATITEKDPLKTPASVTTITAEDIALTPARNLLDLLEIYVPGAFYEVHVAGFQPGIRGIIADRPYKFLVNINGININIKAIYGAQLELTNWDLDDIEKIEIIRGPGSVTYGPGAIGGVINITTKAVKENNNTWNVKYWDKYDSYGVNQSFSHLGESAEVYGFFSVVDTQGLASDNFYVGSSAYGYRAQPDDYLADYHDQPQVKAHIDAHFKNNWRFWARYNAANSYRGGQWGGTQYEVSPGNWQNFVGIRLRYIQTAVENFHPISDTWSLKQLYGLGSIETHIVESYDSDLADNDPESLRNSSAWAEHRAFARLMFQYEEETSPVKAAVGAEISYDMIRPEWGDSADTGLRVSSNIISGPGSEAYGTDANGFGQINESSAQYYPVGEGWETWTWSPMAELNWTLNDQDTVLISGRADKHRYTSWMFSPRVAWIRQLDQDTFFKLIGQRSVRMNAQEELYMNHVNNIDNDPEVLHTVEAIYNTKYNPYTSISGAIFWNHLDAIAWNFSQSRTTPIGTLQSMGLELEGKYKKDDLTVGLNHSYVKQLDWDVENAVQVSGISYFDYYRDAGSGVIITSKGNELSNWPSHATKLYLNRQFDGGRYTFHGDLVTFWGFEGLMDGLDALEEAGGDAAAIAEVRSKDAYKIRMTANISLARKLGKASTLILYLQNIPVIGDNKRYGYSSGYKNTYPDKSNWIEEPMVFGLSYLLKF